MRVLATAIAFLVLDAASARSAWRHDWNTVGDMAIMHGSQTDLFSTNESHFAATHYKIVTGGAHPKNMTCEASTLLWAQSLRESNPSVKNVFYWKSDFAGQLWYNASSAAWPEFVRHPEWSLRTDNGTVVTKGGRPGGTPLFDTRVKSFQEFWASIAVNISKALDKNGQPLINGIFIDGLGSDDKIPGMTDAESMALYKGGQQMVHDLQIQLDALGKDQTVIVNGMDLVDDVAVHASIGGGSMVDHFGILQFLDPVTGEWLPEPMKKLLFDVVRAPASLNRTLQIKTWPGPIVNQKDIWPNASQPTTQGGMQRAAQEQLNTALALFLLVAEDQSWMCYSWFWGAGDYIPFGKGAVQYSTVQYRIVQVYLVL
jgi:hypothetical protein